MAVGIYCYIDKKDDSIVYIGKDSNIDKNRRHNDHFAPYAYNLQQINRVLQNNPKRYVYKVLKSWKADEYPKNLANILEIIYIRRYNPKFNFTKGGEGIIGFRHSEETKQRLSEHFTGKTHSKKTRIKMSESKKGVPLSEFHKRSLSESRKGMKFTEIHKKNISKNHADFSGKNHPQSKYNLWDNAKCHYSKSAMFRKNRDGTKPYSCFIPKYKAKILPIGGNLDFKTCELINNLIEEFKM